MCFRSFWLAIRVCMGATMPVARRQRLTRVALTLATAMAVLGALRLAVLVAVENPTNARVRTRNSFS